MPNKVHYLYLRQIVKYSTLEPLINTTLELLLSLNKFIYTGILCRKNSKEKVSHPNGTDQEIILGLVHPVMTVVLTQTTTISWKYSE